MTDVVGAGLDPAVNGSHARAYIDQAKGLHGEIVRFQRENAALRARVAELEAGLTPSQRLALAARSDLLADEAALVADPEAIR